MAKKSVKLYTDNVIEEFYSHLANGTLKDLHIPHSDVFYVREISTEPLWEAIYVGTRRMGNVR